ncbi:MAG: hypothetical protein ACI8QS_002843 [Planctomycetota bacterium]
MVELAWTLKLLGDSDESAESVPPQDKEAMPPSKSKTLPLPAMMRKPQADVGLLGIAQ